VNKRCRYILFVTCLVVLCAFGCQKTYYAVWEKLGKEKRHLLKDQVQKARTDQQKASEEFKDVLTRVKELYGFKGGDLEKVYNKLRDDYEKCEKRKDKVEKRIDQVEQIASDLFKEWENEIKEITHKRFKAKSKQALKDTRDRYARLNEAMVKAKSKMEPVLGQLRNYVLYLKHNLNAQAIGALKKEVEDIEVEVGSLIDDIAESINEADDFLKNFE
jgi:hypothetical protein